MHGTQRVILRAFLLGLLAATVTLTTAAEPKIDLRTVKYDDLIKEVRSHRGKVVVVDIWANYCVPCKKEFPNLVRMREMYGKDGFVAISLNLDDPKEPTAPALAFLTKMKASDVINLHLDEDADFWSTKFNIKAVPAVFVFDRDNRIALKMADEKPVVDYKVIEDKVKDLLK